MSTTGTMTPIERTRRFWTAHGRSAEHLTVLHAFSNNPSIEWTPEGLSLWYGVRVDRARAIVGDFTRCGIVRAVPERAGRYRWNGAQDWAVPRGLAGRTILQDRWASQSAGPEAVHGGGRG